MTAGGLTDCQMSHDFLGGGNRCEDSVQMMLLATLTAAFVFLQQSSVCGAALHSGVIDNDGGWLDVTRLGRKQPFIKSYRNGIQSVGYGSDQRAPSRPKSSHPAFIHQPFTGKIGVQIPSK